MVKEGKKAEFKELLNKLDDEVKKSGLNKKFEDATIPIGDKHSLLMFDTTEVRISKNAREDGRILFFTKVNAIKNEENNEFNINKNKVNKDTDYVAFEIMPLLKKHLLENKKLQEKFMSYIALYFLSAKRENRDIKNHFIGFLGKADDDHFIQSIREKDEKYYKKHLERIIKAHSDIEK
ncbi:MAG: hypothetical protein J5881_00595 [Clostridia bacterium]|nr:hypothetical protein [Clostridia bacterium]